MDKNRNINITPTTAKEPGYIKRPYVKCAACGNKMFFNAVIGPGDKFSLHVVNSRGPGEDKLQLMCGKCDKVTVIGLERGPTIKDN